MNVSFYIPKFNFLNWGDVVLCADMIHHMLISVLDIYITFLCLYCISTDPGCVNPLYSVYYVLLREFKTIS